MERKEEVFNLTDLLKELLFGSPLVAHYEDGKESLVVVPKLITELPREIISKFKERGTTETAFTRNGWRFLGMREKDAAHRLIESAIGFFKKGFWEDKGGIHYKRTSEIGENELIFAIGPGFRFEYPRDSGPKLVFVDDMVSVWRKAKPERR